MSVILALPAQSRRGGTGGRQSLVEVAHLRLMILMLIFAAGVAAILVRLAMLALSAEPASAAGRAGAAVARADLVDRNQAPLARMIDAWAIAVRPQQVIGDKDALADRLAEIMPERSAIDYRRMLHSTATFTYLKRGASPELVKRINALGEPAIEFPREPERFYPQSELGAHVLGFLNRDARGVQGMERALESRLIGSGASGRPVALSIDVRVQGALESELMHAMASFQAAGAAGVILDVDTGEVMAMTSLPSFNPNAIDGRVPPNNVTQSVYELGSTFKPLAMALAIDSGVVPSMAKRFDAVEPLRIGRFSIKDDHPQRRFLNIPETLIYSSNIATARISEELGRERLEGLFRKLGFDTPPDIEIEKARPLWPSDWGRATTMTVGFGHGIAITPLHLASAYATLVNGGVWRPATLVKVEPGKAAPGRRVIQESTSARMRQLLRLIVTDGTGSKADAPGYRVGGKTGTAEKPGEGGYSKSINVSTFAAAFPMDAPRYVVIVMLDSPIGNQESAFQRTAGWTAAPVVSRLIQRTGPMLGVMPESNRDIDLSDLKPLIWRGGEPAKADQ